MGHHARQRHDLTIIHSNIRNLYGNRTELEHLILERDPDIVSLNETHLGVNDKFTMRGYRFIRKDRNRRGGGVALLCRDTLPITDVTNPPQFNNFEHVTIKLAIHNYPIFITTLYVPPNAPFPTPLINHLNTNHKSIILSDLNASNIALGDRRTNAAGRQLELILHRTDFKLIPTAPTRYPQTVNDIHATTPDRILTTPPIFNRVLQAEILPPLNSDHCPIELKITTPIWSPTAPITPRKSYKYHQSDWDTFTEYFDLNLPPPSEIKSLEDLENADEILLKVTCDARDKAVPRTRNDGTIRRRLPPYIIDIIKTKRRAHRLYMRDHSDDNRRLYRKLQQDVRNAIQHYEQTKWRNIINQLNSNHKDNPGRFWKLINKLKGNTFPQYPLINQHEVIFNTEDKLEHFHRILSRIHTVPHHPDYNEPHYNAITAQIENNPDIFNPLRIPYEPQPLDHPIIAPITTQEIEHAIHKTRNTAAGPDSIHNILFKNYPPTALNYLANLFTASLYIGALPARWKLAHILMFPKPNKDATDANNYRPISLTQTICKLMERIINNRLHHFIEDNDIIPDTQAGFRKGIEIPDQILKILTPIESGFERHMTSTVVTIDTTRAFDSIWHDGLRYKLHNIGLPPPLTRWLSDFIRNRTAHIKINSSLSQPFQIEGGVPQGTVLSPILFNIYVSDIPIPPREGVHIGQFADDIIITATAHDIRYTNSHVNETLRNLNVWLDMWRMRINPAKSQTMILKKRRYPKKLMRDRYAIRCKNSIIPYTNHITYLGITISNKLKLHRHVINIKSRITNAIKLLYNVAGNQAKPGCRPHTTALIYKSIIRPSLLHASQLFSRVSNSQLSQLESLERRLLRKTFQLPRNTQNRTVYTISNIKPITLYIQHKNIKYTHKAINKNFTSVLFQTIPPGQPHLTVSRLMNDHQEYLARQH